jgi:DNA-binding MarR family transcriptional regulator
MDQRLYFALNVATQALRQYVDARCMQLLGLTSAQAGVLFYVSAHDGCLLKDLAHGLELKSSAITGLVERTERTGCIRRASNEQDARATRVELTSIGRKKLAQLRKLNAQLNAQLRGEFSDKEIDTVLRFLSHVRALDPDQK